LIVYNHHATKIFQACLNVHKPLTGILHPSVCFWVLHMGRIPASSTYIRSSKRTESMWTYSDHCYIRAEKTWFSHLNGLCYNSSVLKLVCKEPCFVVATVVGNGHLLLGLTQRDKHFWSSCCLHHPGRKWQFLHQWSWFGC